MMDERTELTGICAGCGVAIVADCSLCEDCERQLFSVSPVWEEK